jgi:hypothetical protein
MPRHQVQPCHRQCVCVDVLLVPPAAGRHEVVERVVQRSSSESSLSEARLCRTPWKQVRCDDFRANVRCLPPLSTVHVVERLNLVVGHLIDDLCSQGGGTACHNACGHCNSVCRY